MIAIPHRVSDGDRDDWVNSPCTDALRKDAEHHLATRHSMLESACAGTSDPEVAKAYATWMAASGLLEMLKGKRAPR